MTVSKKRILIADAHPGMIAGVGLLLKGFFDVTVMVADISSLSDVVANSAFDVVIADLSLSRLSDEHIVRLLKRLRPDVRLIVLSVYDEPMIADECLAAGAQGFVLKHAAVDDLVPAVQTILKGQNYISPSLAKDFHE